MIYFMQKSKKSLRRRQFKLSLNDAKQYLYNIDTRKFKVSEIMIYSSDTPEEIKELNQYFVDDFLISSDEDVIGVLRVNETISKYDRLRNKGASIKSLKNFRKKIEENIPGSEVSMVYNPDTFEIFIVHPSGDVKIVCNYQLVIINSFASTLQGEFVNLNDNDAFVKIVNKLFIKQRYYYKAKNNG